MFQFLSPASLPSCPSSFRILVWIIYGFTLSRDSDPKAFLPPKHTNESHMTLVRVSGLLQLDRINSPPSVVIRTKEMDF